MATIVNTPAPVQQESSNGLGFLLGIVLLFILGILFFVYGLPILSRSVRNTAPSVTVPDEIDVNVNQGEGGQ